MMGLKRNVDGKESEVQMVSGSILATWKILVQEIRGRLVSYGTKQNGPYELVAYFFKLALIKTWYYIEA